MTVRQPYKERQPGSIKEAVATLVVACGGQAEASNLCRVSRAHIARYTDDSTEHEFTHMPVDIVALLEAHCGDPIVTRYLAMRAGALLVQLHGPHDEPYSKLLAAIGRETGRFYAEACEALGSGAMTAKHAGRVMRDALKLAGAIAALIADLRKLALPSGASRP